MEDICGVFSFFRKTLQTKLRAFVGRFGRRFKIQWISSPSARSLVPAAATRVKAIMILRDLLLTLLLLLLPFPFVYYCLEKQRGLPPAF